MHSVACDAAAFQQLNILQVKPKHELYTMMPMFCVSCQQMSCSLSFSERAHCILFSRHVALKISMSHVTTSRQIGLTIVCLDLLSGWPRRSGCGCRQRGSGTRDTVAPTSAGAACIRTFTS